MAGRSTFSLVVLAGILASSLVDIRCCWGTPPPAPATDGFEEWIDALPRLGYLLKERLHEIRTTEWEATHLEVASRRGVSIRSTFPVAPRDKLHYRFVVVEEKYPTSLAAQARMANVYVMPPGLLPEERKAFPLRQGFQIGKRVYVVSTDVAMFSDVLGQMSDDVRAIVSDATADERKAAVEAIRGRITKELTIANVQDALARRGVYRHAVDGKYGPALRSAVEQFQRTSGQLPDGKLTQELLKSLGVPEDPLDMDNSEYRATTPQN